MDSLVYFEKNQLLTTWDAQIGRVCHEIDTIVDVIKIKFPTWVNSIGEMI
jgi:hypothetical protein